MMNVGRKLNKSSMNVDQKSNGSSTNVEQKFDVPFDKRRMKVERKFDEHRTKVQQKFDGYRTDKSWTSLSRWQAVTLKPLQFAEMQQWWATQSAQLDVKGHGVTKRSWAPRWWRTATWRYSGATLQVRIIIKATARNVTNIASSQRYNSHRCNLQWHCLIAITGNATLLCCDGGRRHF